MLDLKKPFTDYDGKTGGLTFSILVVINVFISLIGQLILGATNLIEGSYQYMAASASFSLISIIITVTLVKFLSKKPLLKMVRAKKFDPYFILPAILLAMGMFFCFGFLNNAIGTALRDAGLIDISRESVWLPNVGSLILCLVMLAILPAFLEEILFRGLLVSAGRKSNLVSIILTIGVMFAIYHASPVKFAYQFIYGVGLTFLAVKSGSVFPPMIAHLINNVVIVVLEYVDVTLNFTAPLVIVSGAVLLVAFIFLTLFLDRRKFKREEKCKNMWIVGSFGVFICALIAVLGLVL